MSETREVPVMGEGEIVEPLLCELSREGHRGVRLPASDVPETKMARAIPSWAVRQRPARLPEVSEPEVIRHFTRLSTLNFHLDAGFYPLGSCTMKHNPKINDEMAALPGFSELHPLSPEEASQGALALTHVVSKLLCEITGFAAATLQPAAGAQGEMTGMLMVRARHRDKGQGDRRKVVIVPDSAHGTNPATAHEVGWSVRSIKSEQGLIDARALAEALSDETAAVMVTLPNTLGLFEPQIREIADKVHEAGAYLYLDGANFNALVGLVKPRQVGFDLGHLNLHKTFSQPHGGGGPGAGPVLVSEELEPYLPVPVVVDKGGSYAFDFDRPRSVGRVHGFYGNFGVLVRTYTYLLSLGPEGLSEVSREAILNANYLKEKLRGLFELPFDRPCMHEFVMSGRNLRKHGVRTLDVAKRLLDFGVHAPTVYFPLIVEEALMIEPTETETLHNLDHFADAMKRIAREAAEEPETLKHAPFTTPVSRLDEGRAARELKLTWEWPEKS
jgi:glycine cleavage system P protein (glycine dehydrogenase) subunit 2